MVKKLTWKIPDRPPRQSLGEKRHLGTAVLAGIRADSATLKTFPSTSSVDE